MGNIAVGQEFTFRGEKVTVIEKIKGGKTNKPEMQSGILFIGYKSNPPTYILSNGMRVRGSTLKNKNT